MELGSSAQASSEYPIPVYYRLTVGEQKTQQAQAVAGHASEVVEVEGSQALSWAW